MYHLFEPIIMMHFKNIDSGLTRVFIEHFYHLWQIVKLGDLNVINPEKKMVNQLAITHKMARNNFQSDSWTLAGQKKYILLF